MADRTSRTTKTRENESRRKPWAPPSHLEAPTPPDGFVHRWVRVAMRGEEDKMNVNAKLREGGNLSVKMSIRTMRPPLLTMVDMRA